jgi:hypothetical protein
LEHKPSLISPVGCTGGIGLKNYPEHIRITSFIFRVADPGGGIHFIAAVIFSGIDDETGYLFDFFIESNLQKRDKWLTDIGQAGNGHARRARPPRRGGMCGLGTVGFLLFSDAKTQLEFINKLVDRNAIRMINATVALVVEIYIKYFAG